MKSVIRFFGACFVVGSLGGLAYAGDLAARVNTVRPLPLRQVYAFVPPAGFTEVVPADGPRDPTVYNASSATPLATMHASYTNGARATDQALLDAKATELVAAYGTAHPGMTAKVVKKELLTVSGTPVAHIVLESASAAKSASKSASKKKAAPPQREAHYFFGHGTHNAEVIYTTDAVSFAKLEPAFEASLQKTHGLATPAAKPATATP